MALVDAGAASAWVEGLITRYGTLERAIAGDQRPWDMDNRLASTLDAVRDLLAALVRQRIEDRPILASWSAVTEYLHMTMAHRAVEAAHVLHLNVRNLLISDDTIAVGTLNQTSFCVREIARRSLELGSAAVILVHNHPSGDPSPSRQDITSTREMVAGLKPLGIYVHDHIIVSDTGSISLRALGVM